VGQLVDPCIDAHMFVSSRIYNLLLPAVVNILKIVTVVDFS
jgi:hypothetical protein